MNIQKYILAVVVASSLFATSCQEAFLDRENENVILTKNYWNTVEDCEIALNSVYNSFKNPSIYAFTDETLRSDIAVQGGNNRMVKSEAGLQTFNDAYNPAKNKWAALYTGIFRANQVIEGVDKVRQKLTFENQLKDLDAIAAQAHFFRGLFYFWLNNTFNNGDVPIIDYVPVNMPEDLYQPISKSDKVVEFIRKDLITALELGMVDKWSSKKDTGRATAISTYTLLGMSYLYEKDYKTAKYYFELVVNSPDYHLIESNNNSTTANEFSPESILEANYTLELNTQYAGESALYNNYGMLVSKVGGWYSMVPAMWLVDTYQQDNVDIKNRANWIEVELDDNYMEAIEVGDEKFEKVDKPADVIYKQFGKRVGTAKNYLVYRYVQDGILDKSASEVPYEIEQWERLKRTYNGYTVRYYGVLVEKKSVDEKNSTTAMIADGDDYVPVVYDDFTPAGKPYPLGFYIFYDTMTQKWYRLRDYSLRTSNSLALNGELDLPYYQKIAQQATSFDSGNTSYFRKYSNWDIWERETDGTPANQSGVNLRVMRLSDVYLMYAETLIEGGQSERLMSEALKYVNKVRQRAGVVLLGKYGEYSGERTYDGLDYTAESLMEHIMYKERPMELALDGCAMRATDLRRWGVTAQRFKDLSKLHFTAIEVPFVSVEDDGTYTSSTRFGYQIPFEATLKPGKDYVDFVQPAQNYNESVATWMIPAVEKISNPYID